MWLDSTLLWLWPKPAAITPSGPLAWELPYTSAAALKSKKKKKKREREREIMRIKSKLEVLGVVSTDMGLHY